jgi:hypothetical protein
MLQGGGAYHTNEIIDFFLTPRSYVTEHVAAAHQLRLSQSIDVHLDGPNPVRSCGRQSPPFLDLEARLAHVGVHSLPAGAAHSNGWRASSDTCDHIRNHRNAGLQCIEGPGTLGRYRAPCSAARPNSIRLSATDHPHLLLQQLCGSACRAPPHCAARPSSRSGTQVALRTRSVWLKSDVVKYTSTCSRTSLVQLISQSLGTRHSGFSCICSTQAKARHPNTSRAC